MLRVQSEISRQPAENGPPPADAPSPAGAEVTGDTFGSIERVISAIARYAAYIGGIGIALLVFATVTDVGRRAVGAGSINGLVDLTEVALVFVVYFGFAQAEADKTHIRTSFVTERLPSVLRRGLSAAVWSVLFAFLLWMVWLTALSALTSFQGGESRASQSGVPVWPARAMVSLGLLGLAIQTLTNVIAAVRGRLDGERE